jgi:predicted DNA-binding transcriptional regulator AlpA
MSEQLLLTSEAREVLRLSRPGFDRLRKREGFPKPIRLGRRSLRWRLSELLAFADATREAQPKSAA